VPLRSRTRARENFLDFFFPPPLSLSLGDAQERRLVNVASCRRSQSDEGSRGCCGILADGASLDALRGMIIDQCSRASTFENFKRHALESDGASGPVRVPSRVACRFAKNFMGRVRPIDPDLNEYARSRAEEEKKRKKKKSFFHGLPQSF